MVRQVFAGYCGKRWQDRVQVQEPERRCKSTPLPSYCCSYQVIQTVQSCKNYQDHFKILCMVFRILCMANTLSA